MVVCKKGLETATIPLLTEVVDHVLVTMFTEGSVIQYHVLFPSMAAGVSGNQWNVVLKRVKVESKLSEDDARIRRQQMVEEVAQDLPTNSGNAIRISSALTPQNL